MFSKKKQIVSFKTSSKFLRNVGVLWCRWFLSLRRLDSTKLRQYCVNTVVSTTKDTVRIFWCDWKKTPFTYLDAMFIYIHRIPWKFWLGNPNSIRPSTQPPLPHAHVITQSGARPQPDSPANFLQHFDGFLRNFDWIPTTFLFDLSDI